MAWGWDSSPGVGARGCTRSSCKWPGDGTVLRFGPGGSLDLVVNGLEVGTVHLQSGPGIALDLVVNGLGVGQFTWGWGRGLHLI